MSIRERSSGFEAEQSSDTEEVTGQEESGDTTAQEEQTEGEKLAQQWGIRISAREKMDLHRVLLEDDFRLFSGHDVDSRLSESFSFAYPKNLYHTVEAEADEDAGRYRILSGARIQRPSFLQSGETGGRCGLHRRNVRGR